MALNWFSQPKASNVDDLIRRKKYGQAIAVIKVAIKKRPADKRLLRRLADVLVLVGQIKEAVKVLNTLADEVALRGNAAEAIAGLGRPTLFVMEGGYAVEDIGVNTVNVLAGFEAIA